MSALRNRRRRGILLSLSRVTAYILWVTLFLVLLCSEIYLDRVGAIKFKSEIDLFGIAGIPLFFVTIVELIRAHRVQAAELVRSHMSAFLMNDDLHRVFHELIYDYSDGDWEKVRSLLPKTLNRTMRRPPLPSRGCGKRSSSSTQTERRAHVSTILISFRGQSPAPITGLAFALRVFRDANPSDDRYVPASHRLATAHRRKCPS
jgi:hypothetical protein